ncbi:3-hydroxyacyl-CoA dehydrogenase [Halogeometricum borinquense DSM 11551]|uniref:enoyl-CoA hydratase n=3 Tax=Halogeometricum borinquense TaxID=60847 RepID=E4NRU1_HALBP|nr:3-hydroxyacyl-CoA dehydrogenase/enoyl-CoA hydratase family protein [Halogeometricum borinquense]ADQ66878.1 3-hydroxyacyl-CoA dehydrogenase; short chain enoyl-CoA hydratase [Halogeometricum borinquense DSM 11551]ELY30385.1 3-hydroxyacyl-CoA dehydrogenase [Halogeometricum borinquense DSM 11551]
MELDDINTITVLGAGNMGHGIAEVAALAGYQVNLRDINEEFVQNGYDQIEWSLGKLAEKDQLSDEEANAALERVATYVDLAESVSDADVVIEAVPEKMDIKKDVYTELEAAAPDHTIFATNTSSLSISELADVTERPEQFCGMHFFNPPVRMQLVEVISGAETAEETMDVISDLAEAMDKTPVRVHKDSPGFIVNRILVPLMNEAAWAVESGDTTIAEVDSTAKYEIGLPMGSFELADQVGIDVGYHVLQYMHEVLGDAYEPCPLLEEKVEEEKLGKKTGKGFYDYEDGEGAQVPSDQTSEDVSRRLMAVMANEVAGLIQNDVADADAIDRAVMLGGGFPDGPAKMADDAGLETLVETLDELHEKTGAERYEAVDLLRELAESGDRFHGSDGGDDADPYEFENISVEIRDRVGHIELDRPHRMNTISSDLVDDLSGAIDALGADDDVRAILLTGAGDRAFSAGADVQSMAGGAGDPTAGAELSRKGQRTFGKLEECDKPVIAAIDGYCLGGGMELSMCADLRIATKRSEFGQPEHNLGLIPGWGGTVRLQRIVGTGRAKEIIFTADRYEAETMADYGFINELVENDEFEEQAFEYAKQFAQGPPVAQRYTKRAMHNGWEDTDAGLEVEAQSFGLLFTTDDLMEGMTAFMGDREPDFKGE